MCEYFIIAELLLHCFQMLFEKILYSLTIFVRLIIHANHLLEYKSHHPVYLLLIVVFSARDEHFIFHAWIVRIICITVEWPARIDLILISSKSIIIFFGGLGATKCAWVRDYCC